MADLREKKGLLKQKEPKGHCIMGKVLLGGGETCDFALIPKVETGDTVWGCIGEGYRETRHLPSCDRGMNELPTASLFLPPLQSGTRMSPSKYWLGFRKAQGEGIRVPFSASLLQCVLFPFLYERNMH